MSKRPTFFWMPESPPCRTVYLVTKLINFNDYELKLIDLSKSEHLSDDFRKINPFHTIPTWFESEDFCLWESRTIVRYLIETRKPESSLYPCDDARKRAVINRCLDYDLGTLFRSISDVILPIFEPGKGSPNEEKIPRLKQVLEDFDKNLKQQKGKYLTGGNEMTLADLVTYFTMILLEVIPDLIDLKIDYLSINDWYERMKIFINEFDRKNCDEILTKANENLNRYGQFCRQNASKK